MLKRIGFAAAAFLALAACGAPPQKGFLLDVSPMDQPGDPSVCTARYQMLAPGTIELKYRFSQSGTLLSTFNADDGGAAIMIDVWPGSVVERTVHTNPADVANFKVYLHTLRRDLPCQVQAGY